MSVPRTQILFRRHAPLLRRLDSGGLLCLILANPQRLSESGGDLVSEVLECLLGAHLLSCDILLSYGLLPSCVPLSIRRDRGPARLEAGRRTSRREDCDSP